MRIPGATYRIQFNSQFGFSQALGIISYLNDLGITDLYASPVFKARKGSNHGYDIVDPRQINPELGSIDDFHKLIDQVKKSGMGWLQDIVPNHMAIDSENLMLMDLLEKGNHSPYFTFFDIGWQNSEEISKNRILIPLLGKTYGEALEAGEIRLVYDEAGLGICYYALRLPIRLESYFQILEYNLEQLEQRLGNGNSDLTSYLGNIGLLKSALSNENTAGIDQESKHARQMLWNLYNSSQDIRQFIDGNLALFNGNAGEPQSFDRLDKLISEQYFRLSFWKVATEELNYRRFFTINDLISVRVEDENVFNQTHSLVLELVTKDMIQGLRVDHIDGLYDPTGYLNRLRNNLPETYIIVEKILQMNEQLPEFWPIQGTTGYDYLDILNEIFCMRENETAFDKIYDKFAGLKTEYDDLLGQKKRLIIGNYMAGDIDNLAQALKAISVKDRIGSDITLYGLRRALVEVIAYFPVYRTYMSDGYSRKQDSQYIIEALSKAKDKNPGLLYELDFIEKFLLLEGGKPTSEQDRAANMHFIMNFQQYTGPLMAKGFEDTVLYIYNRLISLNEVGGDPGIFGLSKNKFYEFNINKMQSYPYAMNATSTHDTKRGEDVRARINVLSEIPGEWEINLKNWSRVNKSKKKLLKNRIIPDGNDEYFLYQTLIGSYPFEPEEDYLTRIKDYIIKSIREAKIHTAWVRPDSNYENAFVSFVEKILKPSDRNRFLKEFSVFSQKISHYGIFNSLSQVLLKITGPGVADFYQGADLWDLSLVDPDNRRAVDFERRKKYLQEIKRDEAADPSKSISDMLANMADGRVKMFLIYKALQLRRQEVKLFQEGTYQPLTVEGQYSRNIIVFAREYENKILISVAPRFLTKVINDTELPLGRNVWKDTQIAMPSITSKWTNRITGQELAYTDNILIGDILVNFPVAILTGTK